MKYDRGDMASLQKRDRKLQQRLAMTLPLKILCHDQIINFISVYRNRADQFSADFMDIDITFFLFQLFPTRANIDRKPLQCRSHVMETFFVNSSVFLIIRVGIMSQSQIRHHLSAFILHFVNDDFHLFLCLLHIFRFVGQLPKQYDYIIKTPTCQILLITDLVPIRSMLSKITVPVCAFKHTGTTNFNVQILINIENTLPLNLNRYPPTHAILINNSSAA